MKLRDAGVVMCQTQSAYDLHKVHLKPLPPRHLLYHQNPEWLTFLVSAYRGCPKKRHQMGARGSMVYQQKVFHIIEIENCRRTMCRYIPSVTSV